MGGLLASQSHFVGLGGQFPRGLLAWKSARESMLAFYRGPMDG